MTNIKQIYTSCQSLLESVTLSVLYGLYHFPSGLSPPPPPLSLTKKLNKSQKYYNPISYLFTNHDCNHCSFQTSIRDRRHLPLRLQGAGVRGQATHHGGGVDGAGADLHRLQATRTHLPGEGLHGASPGAAGERPGHPGLHAHLPICGATPRGGCRLGGETQR